MDQDNWADRNNNMRCRTCRFFVPKKRGTELMFQNPHIDPAEFVLGRCRWGAPVVQQGWPAVFASDWCGQHKLDENRVEYSVASQEAVEQKK